MRARGVGRYRCLVVRAARRGPGRRFVAQDAAPVVSSRLGTAVPDGGERFAAPGGSSQIGPGEAGIRQFVDIGTGIPSAGNVHEVAGQVAPGARVVYVDNDR
jgi:S-adenosyl methyltransferase